MLYLGMSYLLSLFIDKIFHYKNYFLFSGFLLLIFILGVHDKFHAMTTDNDNTAFYGYLLEISYWLGLILMALVYYVAWCLFFEERNLNIKKVNKIVAILLLVSLIIYLGLKLIPYFPFNPNFTVFICILSTILLGHQIVYNYYWIKTKKSSHFPV
ncbi:hypothetical protein ACVR0S_02395 [Streptococcus dentapri]